MQVTTQGLLILLIIMNVYLADLNTLMTGNYKCVIFSDVSMFVYIGNNTTLCTLLGVLVIVDIG